MDRRIFLGVVIVLLLIWLLLANAKAGVDIGITPNFGYTNATWDSGRHPSPTGEERDSSYAFGGAVQIIYDRWKFKPTAELSISYAKFDFSTSQAPTQFANPMITSARIGLTKDLNIVEVYGLVGYSLSRTKAGLVERTRDGWLNHGSPTVTDGGVSLKFGIYRLMNLWGFKVGPELSVEVFPYKLGFERCREFKFATFNPRLGLRVQF